MSYFIAGLLLGLVVSWFYFSQPKSGKGFSELLRKQIDLSGFLGQVEQSAQRIDSLERRCYRLEKKLAGAVEKEVKKRSPAEKNITGRRREQVLALWEKGWPLNEVVRRTGLSKGEIELILSLQEYH